MKLLSSISLSEINSWSKNTMLECLNIEFTKIGDNYLCAEMPVNKNTHQPYGILHGGASVALAESVGSTGSALLVDLNKFMVNGIEINANHIRTKKDGVVTAKATILHKGRTTHIWEVKITDELNKLICVCRITNIVIKKVE